MPPRSRRSWRASIPRRQTRTWRLPSPPPSRLRFQRRLVAQVDDDYWRDTRSVIQPDGTRIGALRPWMTAELAKDGGDIKAIWARLKDTDLQITEWRGTSAFVFAPTGPATADYVSAS